MTINETFDLLSEQQARALLGVRSRTTMRAYRNQGLPHVKLFGRVLFNRDNLLEFVKNQQRSEKK